MKRRVARITEEQANELNGLEFVPGGYFYPVLIDGVGWVISEEVVNQCTNTDVPWVNTLPITEEMIVWSI